MVFGQSRQEDLITYLLAEVPEAEREKLVKDLQIDLSPPGKKLGQAGGLIVEEENGLKEQL
jgi:hypothetical protein